MIARDIAAESYFYFLELPGKIYERRNFQCLSLYNYNPYQKLIYLSTLVLHFLTFVIDRIADLLMVRKDFICTVHALYNGRYGMSGNTYIEERGRMIIKSK